MGGLLTVLQQKQQQQQASEGQAMKQSNITTHFLITATLNLLPVRALLKPTKKHKNSKYTYKCTHCTNLTLYLLPGCDQD